MSKDVAKKGQERLPVFKPATDIIEQEDGFHICMDMPGVAKDDLIIDLNKNEVVVSGSTRYGVEAVPAGRNAVHVEFGGATYSRSFTLSDTVDRDKIEAKLENGVLNLFLPKAEEVKPKRIQISAG